MQAKLTGHFWKTLKVGTAAVVPILILWFLGKFVVGLILSMVATIPLKPWVTVAAFLALFYLIGLISRKTRFAAYLKKEFPFPLVHWAVGMIFPSKDEEQGEVFFYPIPGNREVRMRGVIKGETDGFYTIHFACPPTPMTGFTLFEVAKNSPQLELTGRGALAYHLYTATSGKK